MVNYPLIQSTAVIRDFQLLLVELGAANSTFISCSLGRNFQRIDLFTNTKALALMNTHRHVAIEI